MAGGGHGLKYADLSLHAPKRWQVLTGQGMCAVMWLWVLYRAKQDGPVVLGWRHPWEGHGHGHGHEHAARGHEEERNESIRNSDQANSLKADRGTPTPHGNFDNGLTESDKQNLKKKVDSNQSPGQEGKTSDMVKRKHQKLEQHPAVLSLIAEDS